MNRRISKQKLQTEIYSYFRLQIDCVFGYIFSAIHVFIAALSIKNFVGTFLPCALVQLHQPEQFQYCKDNNIIVILYFMEMLTHVLIYPLPSFVTFIFFQVVHIPSEIIEFFLSFGPIDAESFFFLCLYILRIRLWMRKIYVSCYVPNLRRYRNNGSFSVYRIVFDFLCAVGETLLAIIPRTFLVATLLFSGFQTMILMFKLKIGNLFLVVVFIFFFHHPDYELLFTNWYQNILFYSTGYDLTLTLFLWKDVIHAFELQQKDY